MIIRFWLERRKADRRWTARDHAGACGGQAPGGGSLLAEGEVHKARRRSLGANAASMRLPVLVGDQRRQAGAHFLHGLAFDLADALGGNTELGSQVVQGRRVFGEPARFDDAPAARV